MMAAIQTVLPDPSDVSQYSFRSTTSNQTEVVEPAVGDDSWVESIRRRNFQTERVSLAGRSVDLGAAERAALETRDQGYFPERARTVRGNVIAVDARKVTCEVRTPTGSVEIHLSAEIFPQSPRFGMVFDLSLSEDEGLLRPVVTVQGEATEIDEEFEMLLRRI